MSKSEAISSPSTKGATSPSADVRTPSYDALPAHVTAWPEPIQATGKNGFSSPTDWLRDIGPQVGVTTQPALTKRIREGSIPAVPLATLSATMPYPVALSGRAGDTIVVANDPSAALPDPGPLRAVVALKSKAGLVQVPTNATTTTLMQAQDRDKAARQAVNEALSRTGENNPASVRLAWVTTNAGEPKVRHIEYRDAKGERLIPTAKQDLEAQISKVDFTSLYTADDLRSDVAKRVSQSHSAPQPGQSTTKTSKVESYQHPGGDSAVDAARASASAPMESRSTGGPSHSFQTRKAQSTGDVFLASQQVDPTVEPTATTPHAVRIFTNAKAVRDLTSAPEGLAAMHAGVQSGFKPLLMKGKSETGEMGPGSQVIMAVREGSNLVIIGAAPYAGVRPGNGNSGQLLARVDKYKAFEDQLIVPAEGVANSGQPVVISPDSSTSTFGVSAELRRNLHAAATQAGGWGGQAT